LNREGELALAKLKRAIGALGVYPLSIDPHLLFRIDADRGNGRT
jgi:hypothetical protein